jgi:hypothetical protein
MMHLEADYLIVGAGAVGLAFADTLLDETDADILILDRHGQPGGHWNDAYPFVSLHQPSAFYGVASTPLGSDRIDQTGPNAGYYELASGPEVTAYFGHVMQHRLLASGRVRYLPMTDYQGAGRAVSLLSGEEHSVHVRRKTVDATYYGTTVPSTHTPKFEIAPGVRMMPPNGLPHLWQGRGERPSRFVILGAGKTAMDVGVWLLRSGAPAEAIQWVCPRDSWLMNRHTTQPGEAFFESTIGGQASLFEAIGAARDVEDLFDRLEAAGVMLRIDPETRPRMFHYATLSVGEVELLRTIKAIVRKGHVRALLPDKMVLAEGEEAVSPGTVFIDCTASAVERRPCVPVFAGDTITLQMVRMPQPAFSAALCAYVEAHFEDDAARNSVCAPIPLPDGIDTYPAAMLANMMNQYMWTQTPGLRDWITACRLDGFGKLIAGVNKDDQDKRAILNRIRAAMPAAIGNLRALLPQAAS